jgi:DNA polymerase-3 subunit alpha
VDKGSAALARSFVHLHTHTEFSMLDGAARVKDVVAKAVGDGMPAVGITDHGNMYGILDFYKECKDQGVTPVLGTELYMAGESRHERPARRGRIDDTGGEGDRGEKLYYHLTALAETTQGYRNLMKLSSEAYLEGHWYKPRCLLEGQEIVTRRGVTPIEEVRPGDEVLTHRGRFRRVLRTMSRRHRGPVFGMRLNNRYGRVTWMTGEHPVLVRTRDGAVQWVEARDVKGGRPSAAQNGANWNSWACLPKIESDAPRVLDVRPADYIDWEVCEERPGFFRLVVPRKKIGPTYRYSQFPATIPLDYDFGYFVGLYVAEGHAGLSEVTWSFHEDEHRLIDHCKLIAEKLTGQLAHVTRGRPDRPGYHGASVRCSSKPLTQLLGNMCGSGARHKRMPDFVFESPLEFQRGLMDGVLDGDGSYDDAATIFTQTSRDLAWQMRMLRATIYEDFSPVTLRPLPDERYADQYRCNFSARWAQRYRRTLADEQYVYRPIEAVLVREYDGSVYNLEVEEDNSYVTDFAVHNCDWDLLDRYHEGLIVTTGCLGGVVLQSMLRDDLEGAVAKAARLQDIFGRDSMFVELQDHGLPEQQRTNPLLLQLARRIQAPLLATNDSHYTDRAHSLAHDALLCVQTGSLMEDPNRFKFHGDEHFLKTAAEMRSLFSELPEACDNTLWIAERADVEIEFGRPQLPQFELPDGFSTQGDYLRHLTFEGARERYGSQLPLEVVERLEYELGVIEGMGFSAYFLVVWDLIRHAKTNGIRVGPGRGSAAGCCVAYCLRIVDLDPIRYDLLFERFLNPGRKQMPDIDMDFDSRYRGEMIRYAAEKYGWDHVAQIITFSTIKARAAVRDAARVLGYPYGLGDRIAKAMPPLVMGRDTPLWACFEQHPKYEDGYKVAQELRDMYAMDPDVKKIVDVATGLEGLRRQDGIHAAAVVITNEPLTEYLPIQRKPGPGEKPEDAPIVTQYEMHGVEELGLLKMDFLGLRNLDVIEMALDLIEQVRGQRPDIDNIPLDDDQTLAMLRKGDSIGVFQLEGGPMRALMRSLAPTSFEDVAALVALYRPGPMAANMHNDYADRKNGRKPVEYFHPDAEDILSDTFGLMVYQEALMRVAQKFAGYSLEEADNLRKACGKKARDLMAKERDQFVAGVERQGYGRPLGDELFGTIEAFADYAFNKSHSYGYGFVAYQTAYLKAHYPAEYLAALLTSVKDDKDKTAPYLAECRALGVQVRVPDVNTSASDFIARVAGFCDDDLPAGCPGVIPFGLSAVRNVGEGIVGQLIEERDKNGPFTDFYDFCQRVDPVVLNKRAVESLIKAGGFDSLGLARKGLLLVHEQIIDRTLARRRERDAGVMSLFDAFDAAEESPGSFDDARIPVPDFEFDKHQKLAFEKEMLGLYVSDHPLMGFEASLRRATECSVTELLEAKDGETKIVGGVVTALVRKYTRKGELMATFVLEDLEAGIPAWVFPRTMQEFGSLLADDVVVVVKGRLDNRDDEVKFVVMEVRRPELSAGASPLEVVLPLSALTDRTVGRLKELLLGHPGPSPVLLRMGSKTLQLADQFRVDTGNGLCAELRMLLGADCIASA